MGEGDLDREDIEGEEATVLPEREAMSIISPGSAADEENLTSEDLGEQIGDT